MLFIRKTLYIIIIISMIIIGCAFLSACASQPENTTKDLSKIVAGFTPKDWKLSDEVKQFTPENLYEHINGRAEFYIAYDVTGMTFANFIKNDLKGPFIDLFIYDMTNPTNAFGVFSAERSKEGSSVKLGRKAYRQGANYYIWKGRYYITIIASETSQDMESIGLELAKKVNQALNDSREEVWGLSAMQQKDMITGTMKYIKRDAMGLDFLNNTYIAQYRKYDIDIKHFLSRNESEQSAKAVVNQYADFANQYGKGTETKSMDGVHLIICDMEDYFDVIFQKNNLVAGVLSVKEKETAVNAATEFFNQLP